MTSVSFDVMINDDNLFENDERYILIIKEDSLPGSIVRGNSGKSTITIVDNDRKYSTAQM